MGRIADQIAEGDDAPPVKPNKLDRILESLDGDDRPIVEAWLADVDVSDEDIEERLYAVDIRCSDSTIRRWRRARRLAGMWAA